MTFAIHHVAFRTHDLERLRAFYTDVIGLEEIEHDGSVWLRAGSAILMLERAEENEPRSLSASKELVAFQVDEATRAALRSRLILARFAIDGESAFTTYVRDPDGRRIGFSHYVLS